jgi:hypothetical protein
MAMAMVVVAAATVATAAVGQLLKLVFIKGLFIILPCSTSMAWISHGNDDIGVFDMIGYASVAIGAQLAILA